MCDDLERAQEQQILFHHERASEAAAQPIGCLCDFCSKLRADWIKKQAEIEHNDH